MDIYKIGNVVAHITTDLIILVTGEDNGAGFFAGTVIGGITHPIGSHSIFWCISGFAPHTTDVTITPPVEPKFKVGDLVVSEKFGGEMLLRVKQMDGAYFTAEVIRAKHFHDGEVDSGFHVVNYRLAVIS